MNGAATKQTDAKVLNPEGLEQKIAVVVGTRPGIVMFAPIIHELRRTETPHFVIHTGQHFSPYMDSELFEDLRLPEPDFKLEGVSDNRTHATQTAAMMTGIERILFHEQPKVMVVGGDANTNLAAALAARKLGIAVAHVEAGERSFDWRMPEEHNRRMIDHISDEMFCTNEKGKSRLEKESVQGRIHVTGNPIVDASLEHFAIAQENSTALADHGLGASQYGLLTMHREENVDNEQNLKNALQGVQQAAEEIDVPIVFLVHPRTEKRLKEFGLYDWAVGLPRIQMTTAVRYLDFLNLLGNSGIVFTDSGGVQQEACIHHIPAVTLRENTEWTETLEHGANRLAGTDVEAIRRAARAALEVPNDWPVPFGDGTCAKQIVAALRSTAPGATWTRQGDATESTTGTHLGAARS